MGVSFIGASIQPPDPIRAIESACLKLTRQGRLISVVGLGRKANKGSLKIFYELSCISQKPFICLLRIYPIFHEVINLISFSLVNAVKAVKI